MQLYLSNVCSKISVGHFFRQLRIEATMQVSHDGEHPAIMITYPAPDATTGDSEPIGLHGTRTLA